MCANIPAGFEECDFSFFFQIFFVPDKENHNRRASQSSGIGQPVCQGIEAFSGRDIVDQ